MTEPCYSAAFICAIRAARLTSGAGFDYGASGLYEAVAPLSFVATPQETAGTSVNVKNGCDTSCFSYEGDPTIEKWTLTTELCQLDAELAEVMTGGTLIVKDGRTVGFEPRPASAGPYEGCSIETWAKAWDNTAQAVEGGVPLYMRFAYEKTTWRVTDQTFGNDLLRLKLTGTAVRNPQFGTGPMADWPQEVSEPGAWFLDDTLPAGVCGYQTLAS